MRRGETKIGNKRREYKTRESEEKKRREEMKRLEDNHKKLVLHRSKKRKVT